MKKRCWKGACKALALVTAVSLLTGCTASIPVRISSGVTLPPAASGAAAPTGDVMEDYAQTVMLCLPSSQSGQLEYFPERILLPPFRHPAEAVLKKLFSHQETTQAKPLAKDVQLSLFPGSSVEISNETATVDLGPSALLLSNEERYSVCRAITNTLTQWGDIRFVNVLVSGRQQGVDTAAAIPLGSLTGTGDEDIKSLWDAANRQPSGNGGFTSFATLYFPVYAGRGVLAETRPVNLGGLSFTGMTLALLQALSAGAVSLPYVPRLPDLVTLLSTEPEVTQEPGFSGRVVHLRFYESANDALITSGIPRSVLIASLTLTLTTFLPYTEGIRVSIGNEEITAVVPAGVYERAGEQIMFDKGIIRRAQFSHFLLSDCDLYFASGNGSLSLSKRPIPYYQANHPRYLINQLLVGPLNTDDAAGPSPVMPNGLSDADILGISRQGDSLFVNFSKNLKALADGMDESGERLMVYSLVDTLTALPGIRRVRFFINGEQEGTFAGGIDIAGEFIRNEGIIQ